MTSVEREVIEEQLKKLIGIIKKEFDGDRKTKLLTMYKEFGERLLLAPASGKATYHNAYPGGYLDHILNVIELSMRTTKSMIDMGFKVDYTREELIFAAMHHDLGKLGDETNPYYIPEPSQWHRENQGSIFKHNPALQYMSVPDRALYLLQAYDIQISNKEWMAIKLSDGMYDDGNKKYLRSYSQDFHIDTDLHHIIHWADHMATVLEKNLWAHANDVEEDTTIEEDIAEAEKQIERGEVIEHEEAAAMVKASAKLVSR